MKHGNAAFWRHSATLVLIAVLVFLAGAALPLVFKTTDVAHGLRTTWVRVHLDDLRDLRGPMALYMQQWFAPGFLAVYADGPLIYRSPGSAVWNLFQHPALLLPLGYGVDNKLPKTLLLRVDWVPGRIAGISSLATGSDESNVWVAITDNGPGFDLEEAQQRGDIRWERLKTGMRLILSLPRSREQLA